jgi:hypothetical protein
MTPNRSMRLAPSTLAFAVVVAGAFACGLAGGLACSKDSSPSTPGQTKADAGAGSTGGTSGATDGPGTVVVDSGSLETAPPPTTCASLRNCVTACLTDTACQQRCIDAAPASARTDYAMVTTCSKMGCPDFNDISCRCQRECMGDGACADLVDGCRGFEDDTFCDKTCGSCCLGP